MLPKTKKYKCPLCATQLTETRYYEIVGVWEEKAKAEKEIRIKLQEAELQKKEMINKQKEAIKKMTQEKAIAIKDGIEKGKQKEKARAIKLSQMVQRQTASLQEANKKIKDLEKHLKDGTTPQDVGRDFEKELEKLLQKHFPNDKIKCTLGGRGGDIFHEVIHKNKVIGSILYECKKTGTFNPDYVHQTKRAVAARKATFGVLVTFVQKKNAQGIYVDNDIIIVHPYGAVHIAQVLRNALIEIHLSKTNQKDLEERSKMLLNFIKGDDFKNSIDDTIYRTRILAELLVKEWKDHNKIWKTRAAQYTGIHININLLKLTTNNILSGTTINKKLLMNEIKQLDVPQL